MRSKQTKCDLDQKCESYKMRSRFPKPRKPTKTEAIRALLGQSPVDPPASLIRAVSTMAPADELRRLATRSDPLDRAILNKAAALAEDSPPDVTSTHDSDPNGWLAYLEAHPVEKL
jgi:hypothetical protein